MKEVTITMNAQITKIIRNVPDFKDSKDAGNLFKNHLHTVLDEAGFDDVTVKDVNVFEMGGAE